MVFAELDREVSWKSGQQVTVGYSKTGNNLGETGEQGKLGPSSDLEQLNFSYC